MASSEKQIAANRENGAKSRGPTTQAGKDRSRHNATKDGLRSRLHASLLPGAAGEQWATLREQLNAYYQPPDEVAQEFIDQMATAQLRLTQHRQYEDAVIDRRREELITAEEQADDDVTQAFERLSNDDDVDEETGSTLRSRVNARASGVTLLITGMHQIDDMVSNTRSLSSPTQQLLEHLLGRSHAVTQAVYQIVGLPQRLHTPAVLEPDVHVDLDEAQLLAVGEVLAAEIGRLETRGADLAAKGQAELENRLREAAIPDPLKTARLSSLDRHYQRTYYKAKEQLEQHLAALQEKAL